MSEQKPYSPIHLIIQQPKGWTDAVMSSTSGLPPIRSAESYLGEVASVMQEQRWVERTGVAPQDSHFTVVVPIHNEANFLRSVMGSLMFLDIPASVDAHFVFVTNNCTDESAVMVQQFIRKSSSQEIPNDDAQAREIQMQHGTQQLSIEEVDPDSSILRSGTIGKIRFSHIDTNTPGKPNALNVGNQIALANEHGIAMCLDANNFPEPDAIAELYGDAYKHIVAEGDGTVVLSGRHLGAHMRNGKDLYVKAIDGIKRLLNRHEMPLPPHLVTGALMAWDTAWIHEIGGIPNVAQEDYALGVISRLEGKKNERTYSAYTHGYYPNNFTDIVAQGARFLRGKWQLAELDPKLLEIMREDDPRWFQYLFSERLKYLFEMLSKRPHVAPDIIRQWWIFELIHKEGARQYEQQANKSTWDPIASTKGNGDK